MDTTKIVTGRYVGEKQALTHALRRQMTPCEKRLWQHLRDNRLGGLHFRRQQVIDGFIADFYCHAAGLIVEADGAVHANRADYDRLRDKIISERRLCILRFSNTRIENELEAVLQEIRVIPQERIASNPKEDHRSQP